MHSFGSWSIGVVALALYITSIQAIPVTTSPLDTSNRSTGFVSDEKTPKPADQTTTTKDLHSRAPCVIKSEDGTTRISPTLPPRSNSNNIYQCAMHGATYVTLTAIPVVNEVLVSLLLEEVYAMTKEVMRQGFSNDVIPQDFRYMGPAGLAVNAWSTNGRETTWQILSEALTAVYEFMYEHQYTGATFTIYNGQEVGRGTID